MDTSDQPSPVARSRIAWRAVATSTDGGIIIGELLASCGVLGSTFCADPVEAAYHEGRRSVGLEVARNVAAVAPQAAAEALMRML